MRKILICICLILGAGSLYAQKKLKKGTITFTLSKVETDIPELMLSEGSAAVIVFDENRQKTSLSMLSGLVKMQTIQFPDEGRSIDLYNFIDKQYYIEEGQEILIGGRAVSLSPGGKDKTLSGYACKSVQYTIGEQTVFALISDKIRTPLPVFSKNLPDFGAFPLEFTLMSDKASLTFTVSKISPEVAPDAFTVPEEYEKIERPEFEQRTGGMNFGF